MATGRSNYLTKQTGEYLVAAELSRRWFIATTFTGNVPHYDIVGGDERGGHALVQVKQSQETRGNSPRQILLTSDERSAADRPLRTKRTGSEPNVCSRATRPCRLRRG